MEAADNCSSLLQEREESPKKDFKVEAAFIEKERERRAMNFPRASDGFGYAAVPLLAAVITYAAARYATFALFLSLRIGRDSVIAAGAAADATVI